MANTTWKSWTISEVRFIKENPKMRDKEIAFNLNRSVSAVENMRFKLGLSKFKKEVKNG